MNNEKSINHRKIRDEIDHYIAQMKAIGIESKDHFGAPNSYVEILRAVIYIEEKNIELNEKYETPKVMENDE